MSGRRRLSPARSRHASGASSPAIGTRRSPRPPPRSPPWPADPELAAAAAGAHGTMLRIVLLNTDYPAFLRWLYRSRPSRVVSSYAAQLRMRNASLFGTADFMSVHLKAAGHDAIDVHANNRPMQEAWLGQRRGILAGLAGLPRRRPLVLPPNEPRFYDILAAQIRDYRP